MTSASTSEIARIAAIFASRLSTLGMLMEKAEGHFASAGRDIAELTAARIAPDMFPFAHQIVFCCNQANQFAWWCADEAFVTADAEAMDFPALKAHVAEAVARVKACAAEDAVLDRVKRIELPGAYLELPGRAYVDDWLMPNFYFHLVMAYALMRAEGVPVGKADYMVHLAPLVRPAG